MYNISENRLTEMFNSAPIDIWINSFGGCRSNYIRDSLKDEYRTYNAAYEYKGCHYIRPLDVNVGSGIFCYVEDVGIALTSQLKRGLKHNFDKLMEEETEFSIRKWLEGIDTQIDNWTSNLYFPTVIINTDKLMDFKDNFEDIYGVRLLPFNKRTTTDYHNTLHQHRDLITKINNKLSELPDFTYINQ